MRRLLSALLVFALVAFAACDDGSSETTTVLKTSGTVTLMLEEGIDFNTGVVQQPGNFGNSDLYTSQNGSALKLASGGSSIVNVRAVTFFQTLGGIYPKYDNIGDVPNVKPTEDQDLPLPKAAAGNGFTIQNAAGNYTKGFILEATEFSVTIQYEPLP